MDGMGKELLVTSAYTEKQLLARIGKPAYSYRIVKRAFEPLLQRWAPNTDIDDPSVDLGETVQRARAQGRVPVQLSFLPMQDVNVSEGTINVAVPAWEFPDIPSTDLGGSPRENWVSQSEKVDLIITHTEFSRNAFLKAGVRTPIRVVPVPANTAYFQIPAWQPRQKVVIDCPCYVLCPGLDEPKSVRPPVGAEKAPSLFKRIFVHPVKRNMPERMVHMVQRLKHGIHAGREAYAKYPRWINLPETPKLELEGVVYTTIFNPGDSRKNWRDIATAFLYALADRPDATLVFKLTTNKKDAAFWLRKVVDKYLRFNIPHACKVVFVTDFLSDAQMSDLARGSTFYINASRAEGSCLPLQDFLAAGRPAIAPPNTGMFDSLDDRSSFLVDSNVEPATWPQNPDFCLNTTWHRINWGSLHDHILTSYRMAHDTPSRVIEMGENARRKMRGLVDPEAVWPLLRDALDEAVSHKLPQRGAA